MANPMIYRGHYEFPYISLYLESSSPPSLGRLWRNGRKIYHTPHLSYSSFCILRTHTPIFHPTMPPRYWLCNSHPSHCTPCFLCNIFLLHANERRISEKLGLVRRFKPSDLYKGISLLLSFPISAFAILPEEHTFSAHAIFRPGPKFHNHQVCRAWMGVHLPFWNTYQEGIYPFMGQTCCYAPDDTNCLFWWADQHSRLHFH